MGWSVEDEPFAGYDAMNPKVKRQWVDALRSGKYWQGKGKLRSLDNKFCCLGVLCDILAPDGWGEEGFFSSRAHQNALATPSSAIRKLSGLDDNGLIGDLAVMNDYHADSFDEIADWIEANL